MNKSVAAIRDRVRELRRVRASELIINKKNFRRHPRAQAEALRDLLHEIGYADALIARELPDGQLEIINGELRAKTTPEAEVPVLVVDVSEEEADKLLVSLDPLAAMAQTDSAALEALLGTVRTDSAAVAAMLEKMAGESAWQVLNETPKVIDVPAQVENAAELQAKWGTALGQAWQIGPHRLICGDCREIATVSRLWGDNAQKFRLIWTDPPYGVNYAAKNAYLNRSDRGNRIQVPIENDGLSAGETEIMFKQALELATQFAVPGAACYATVPGGPLFVYFIQALQASGFEFKHQLVWVKQQFVIGMADYHHRFEPILYSWLPNAAHYFVNDRTQDDVFEVDRPNVSDTHPTCKPVELIARMIANSSRRGELVYDPFSGSGSTLVAAHQLDRIAYGVEIDPGYVAVALQRLADLGLEPKLIEE